MSRKVVLEYSREATARLQGQVSALEFIAETARQQLIREQVLIAKLAAAATACGIELKDVFTDEEDVYHVQQCVRVNLREQSR